MSQVVIAPHVAAQARHGCCGLPDGQCCSGMPAGAGGALLLASTPCMALADSAPAACADTSAPALSAAPARGRGDQAWPGGGAAAQPAQAGAPGGWHRRGQPPAAHGQGAFCAPRPQLEKTVSVTGSAEAPAVSLHCCAAHRGHQGPCRGHMHDLHACPSLCMCLWLPVLLRLCCLCTGPTLPERVSLTRLLSAGAHGHIGQRHQRGRDGGGAARGGRRSSHRARPHRRAALPATGRLGRRGRRGCSRQRARHRQRRHPHALRGAPRPAHRPAVSIRSALLHADGWQQMGAWQLAQELHTTAVTGASAAGDIKYLAMTANRRAY